MKTPVTRKRLRNHLTYSWWKYALLIVFAVFGWNIIYTVTQYRAPEDKKVTVNMYVYGDQDALNAYMAEVNATLMPEMEQMDSIFTALDDSYGDMILSTHMAASEGDIYLLDRTHFQQSAAAGAFLPLETETELVAMLEGAGVSLSQGWRTESETGARHLYGIPCAALPGMASYVYMPDDCYMAVLISNQNDENVLRFLNIFVGDLLAADVQTEEAP